MIIREERKEDFAEISALVEKAFESAEIVDGDEAECVNFLRKSKGYIPQLALVAEENGKLIGHIMLTQTIVRSELHDFIELMLSPLCVALEYRSKGIGGALIEESAKIAGSLNYSGIFLCGYPEYYSKHGFVPAAEFGITHKDKNAPAHRIMAREIYKGALSGKRGTIDIWFTG